MVSRRLLMTNHHVLTSAEVAARSTVKFDYQRDRLGREVAFQAFKLDPAIFFLNDKELDFALVAVSPDGPGRALGDYMWCPLLKEPGKIVTGEPINIIQHPKGERKQVVSRKNRLLDALDGADRGRPVLPLRGGHRARFLRTPVRVRSKGIDRRLGGLCHRQELPAVLCRRSDPLLRLCTTLRTHDIDLVGLRRRLVSLSYYPTAVDSSTADPARTA